MNESYHGPFFHAEFSKFISVKSSTLNLFYFEYYVHKMTIFHYKSAIKQ